MFEQNILSAIETLKGKEGGLEAVEDRTRQTGFTVMLEALSYTIDRLSCEVLVILIQTNYYTLYSTLYDIKVSSSLGN